MVVIQYFLVLFCNTWLERPDGALTAQPESFIQNQDSVRVHFISPLKSTRVEQLQLLELAKTKNVLKALRHGGKNSEIGFVIEKLMTPGSITKLAMRRCVLGKDTFVAVLLHPVTLWKLTAKHQQNEK